jgi:HAD superfamily hydrolase (TIGR01549 family)
MDLAALLQRTHCLLLDFDGPICAIFAGRPARTIARDLVDAFRADDHLVPEHLDTVTDPFDVLRYAATLGTAATERTDARLRQAEIDAVATATPTPHAEKLITTWRRAGRRVAAISNNSEDALAAYVAHRGLQLDLIVGRKSPDPTILKPNPHLVARAISMLHADPRVCTFVGDSASDIVAGRRVGVPTIGLANKAGKRQRLVDAGASVVVDDMEPLIRPGEDVS